MAKYHNTRVQVGDIWFDSKKEARRWTDLQLLQQAGVITDLERQVRYRLEVNGIKITTAVIDFRYYDNEQERLRLEDVKGYENPKDPNVRLYRAKHRLIQATHNIEVEIYR